MRLTLIAAAALLAGTLPAAAAFRSVNGLTVAPAGDGFEVMTMAGRGALDYWCAAGDFARRRLGASTGSALTLTRGQGPSTALSGRRSVAFAPGGTPGGLASPGLAPGSSFTVGQTKGFCQTSLQRMEPQRGR
jgi:hypothetical protein